jgi:methylated-DNA-[protein]-cysteine S-methyltransferase
MGLQALEAAPGVRLRISAGDAGVSAVRFCGECGEEAEPHPLAVEAARQLRAYLEGKLYRFDLPLDLRGTEFQLRVWRALLEAPYGETRSYREVAESIGAAKAVRAVGAANGANPVAIVVPCHRVVGATGKLTGYGGGLAMKRRLLELEARWAWRSRG